MKMFSTKSLLYQGADMVSGSFCSCDYLLNTYANAGIFMAHLIAIISTNFDIMSVLNTFT